MAELHVAPVTQRDAFAFAAEWHRHLGPPPGSVLQIGVADSDGQLRGVVIVGRPVARHFDDGLTLEVNRTATDGAPNACSMLYAAAWRAVRALGYRRLITYTLASEPGSSLRGAGWRVVAERRPHAGWDRPSRRRGTTGPAHVGRTLWEAADA